MSKFLRWCADILTIFYLILRSFILFLQDFNGSSTRREDAFTEKAGESKRAFTEISEKMMENACGGDQF